MPIWFPFVFLLVWLAVTGMLALVSGWVSLARTYRAATRPEGIRLARQVTSVGLVPENGVTDITVATEGLYLSAFPVFRFLRPPLLIPWCDVRIDGNNNVVWLRRYQLDLGSTGTITVKRRAYDAIRPHLVPGTATPN
jgi:hypothetical protein